MNLMASALSPLKKENSLSNIHAEVERNRKVKDIALTDLDQALPVCDACTGRIISELIESRNLAAKETQMFSDELARLSMMPGENDDSQLQQLLQLAEEEEIVLLEKSKLLESERTALRRAMEELHEHAEILDQMHKNYWRDYNELQLQLRSNERESLRRKIEFASQQLVGIWAIHQIVHFLSFFLHHTGGVE